MRQKVIIPTSKLCLSILIFNLLFSITSLYAQPQNSNIATTASNLKVGIILPLSGPVANMGNAFKNGINLYLEENKHQEPNVILEDGRYDGKTTISAFYKLVNVDKVSLIIVWGNTPGSAIAPIAERSRVPTIVLTHMPLALNMKWVVSFGQKAHKVMDKIDQYFKNLSCNSVASFSVDLGNALESIDILDKMRAGNLIKQVFSSTDSDFKNAIATLKKQSVDCLLVFMLSEQANSLFKQLHQFKYFPKIIGGDIFDDYVFLQTTKASNLNVAFADGAVNEKFRAKFTNQKGSFVYSTAVGYVITKLAFDITSKAPLTEYFITNLKLQETSDQPVEGLRLLQDNEYGWHFENDVKVYSNSTISTFGN